jgi:hypothetical protein
VDWKAEGGKSGLVRVIHSLGLSYRKSERGVNVLFEVLANALDRGESVEIPGGSLYCHTVKRKSRVHFSRINNIATGDRRYAFIKFRGGGRRYVSFCPDPNLEIFPAPPVSPPQTPPPTPAQQHDADNEELLTRLMGQAPGPSFIRALEQYIQDTRGPHRPDSLYKRLRELDKRGRRYTSEFKLQQDLYDLYWL